jgi:hypothetical protein
MTEPGEVELWPCGCSARCSTRECRRRTTTILRDLHHPGAARSIRQRLATPTRASWALS